MLGFLLENLATILIALLVVGLVILAVRSIWKNKKQGGCGCGCSGGCAGCSAGCHSAHRSEK